MEPVTILIVEDESGVQRMLEHIFSINGYVVAEAANGEEGISEYQKSKPSLIITDINMPRINGVEFISLIRSIDKEIPIIAITGLDSTALAVMLMRDYTLSDFITKPFEVDSLLRSVKEALTQGHQSPLKKLLAKYPDIERHIPTAKHQPYSVAEQTTQELSVSKLTEYKTIMPHLEWSMEPTTEGHHLTPKNEPSSSTEETVQELSENKLSEYRTIMAALAHDLKNEFSRMAPVVKSLATSRSLDDEDVIIIKLGVEYGQMIVRRFLNLLDMGLSPPQPVSMVATARKAEDIVRPRLRPNVQFALAIDLDPSLQDFRVVANPEQLLLVLVDLIRNAGEAIGSKPGVITLRVSVRDSAGELTVSDDGPGIPSSLKEQLFTAPLKKQGGVGLGLYLSSKIVKSWDGEISIDETKNTTGTSMKVSLRKVSPVEP
jgi:two-component system, NtrC family, sensor kinase